MNSLMLRRHRMVEDWSLNRVVERQRRLGYDEARLVGKEFRLIWTGTLDFLTQ